MKRTKWLIWIAVVHFATAAFAQTPSANAQEAAIRAILQTQIDA